MRRKYATISYTLLIFLINLSFSQANFLNQQGHKTKLTACSVEWPPYTIKENTSDNVRGIHSDILQEIALDIGIKIEGSEMNWNRCLAMVKNGRIDMVYGASKKPEREEFMIYPKTAMHRASYSFATVKGAKHGWDNSMDVKKIPSLIGSPEGFSVTQALQTALGKAAVDNGATSDIQNVLKLTAPAPRIQSLCAETGSLRHIIKTRGIQNIALLKPAYKADKDYYFTVSRKYQSDPAKAQTLCNALDAALVKLKENGRVAAIEQSYYK